MKDNSEMGFGLLSSQGVPTPLEGVHVRADIVGRGASVKICQHFWNRGQNPIEAVYKFPLPEGAAVCGFKAFVGERVIEGTIEEREKAFEIYDEALSRGHGAQLLDQERPNIFTLSVGNIKPGDSTVIEISYIELLDSNGADIRFFLPTTISPRYIPADQPDRNGIPVGDLINPPLLPKVPYGLTIDINVHERQRISSIESPSHTIVTRFTDGRANISFSSEVAAMDRDFVLNVAYEKEFSNRGFLCTDQGEAFVQVDFAAGMDGAADEGADAGNGREMIFVLDCSGSMGGESIAEAKKALKIAVKALKPGMLFNIYLFGSTFERLYPHSMSCGGKTLREALKYLNQAAADMGGTEILAPLRDIYGDKLLQSIHRDILLITDGEVGNESEVMKLVKRNAGHTKVYTVGIGSGPNEFFIKGVARASGGASEMVAPMEKIETKIDSLFRNALAGMIEDIRISWDADVSQAPEAPVLFLGQPCSLFARLKDASREVGSLKISGRTLNGSREWIVDIKPVTENGLPVSKLWARARIRDLEESQGTTQGSRQKERVYRRIEKEIIGLSKKYGIISGKTSFVGVDERPESERSKDEIVFVKVPGMLTKGWGGLQDRDDQLMDYCMVGSIPDIIAEKPLYCSLRKAAPDLLKGILSLQRDDGGFDFGRELAESMRLSYSDVERIVERIEMIERNVIQIRERHAHLRSVLSKFRSEAKNDVQRWREILEETIHVCSDRGAKDEAVMLGRHIQQFMESIEMNVEKFMETIMRHIEHLAVDIEPRLSGLDPGGIVATMIALHLLEAEFGDRRPEWEGIARKSRLWLDDQMARVAIVMDPGKLEYDIRKLVENGLHHSSL